MASFITSLLHALIFGFVADAFVRNSIGFNPRSLTSGHGLGLHATKDVKLEGPHPSRPPELFTSLNSTSNAKFIVKASTEARMDQLVDHFADGAAATFSQRYWHNSVYHKRGGPVFLKIGGEGEVVPYELEDVNSPFMQMARSNNAMMFLLEHRYYGKSRPTKNMRTANLKYLSSQQALEDIAAFIEKMNAEFNLTNSKWITFGGSYAGSLSAWMRTKYPNLVSGAVSSSAPMLAQVNFIGCLEVVQAALTSYSPICANNVHAAFVELQRSLKTAAGRPTLKRLFSLCDDFDNAKPEDVTRFYDRIISNYRNVVASSGVNRGVCHQELTIAKICEFHMVNATIPPLRQLADVNTYVMEKERRVCLRFQYKEMIDIAKATTYSTGRAWRWQMCTEFGFFPSTDSTTAGAFFGHMVPINYHVKQCTDIFGSQYNNQSVNAAVDRTNSIYGGIDNFKGTRVVFTNGGNDPWHELGIVTSKPSKYKAVLITGAAHCADILPACPSDVPALTQARQIVASEVAGWVGSP